MQVARVREDHARAMRVHSAVRASAAESDRFFPGTYGFVLVMLVAFDLFATAMPTGFVTTAALVHGATLMISSMLALWMLLRKFSVAIFSPLSYILLITAMFQGGGTLFFVLGNST